MDRNDFKKILEGSFEAGILIDGSKGSILFANETAQELFGLTDGTPGRFSKSIASVDSFFSFWSYSILDCAEGRRDTMAWSEVFKYVKNHPKTAPDEWFVSAKRRDRTSFPGLLRLTVFSSNLAMAYVLHKDKHLKARSSSISIGTADSYQKQRRFSNPSTEPSVTIDEKGTILTVNQTALDTVTWCNDKLIGKNIVEAAGWSSGRASREAAVATEQPSMTVGEDGIVLTINQAARDRISWCNLDLVGHPLSCLGGDELFFEARSIADTAGRSATDTAAEQSSSHRARSRRWSFKQAAKSSSFSSKSSPDVLRLVIQPTQSSGMDPDKESLTQQSDAQQRDSILLAIFEASLDPLFQVTEHGIIQMVNSAAVQLFGWSREDFLGGNISMICGGSHGSSHQQYMERYLSTGDTRVIGKRRELPAKRKDGIEFPIELALVEVDTFLDDERLFCGFVRDLTHVKEEARAQLRRY